VTLRLPEIGFGCANALRATTAEIIDAASSHGFRRITANPAQYRRSLDAGLTDDDLRRRLDEAGLTCTMLDAVPDVFPGGGTLRTLDPALHSALGGDRPIDEALCFRVADALGIRLLNVNHYMGDTTIPVADLAAGLADFCQRAARRGFQVCVEFIPDSGIPDIEAAQAVIEACGETNVGILFDLFHHVRGGGTVDDVAKLPPRAINSLQLSDRIAPPPGTPHVPLRGRLLPGEGEVPIAALAAAALDNNPDITIDVEVLNDELAALDVDAVAARLANALKRWTSTLSG
jgi:sugar phosphate isomerase/epimerase